MTFIYVIYLSLILALSACAPLKQLSPELLTHKTPNQEHPNKPPQSFNISGAIGAKNKHHAWTATFYWTQQDANNYQILIYGPVGSTAIEITRSKGLVTYREGKKIIRTQQADLLLAKETGIRLPVDNLYYWIRGKAAPGKVTSQRVSDEHDLLALQQAGFNIIYSDYHEHYPRKLFINGHELMIKIVIKHWQAE